MQKFGEIFRNIPEGTKVDPSVKPFTPEPPDDKAEYLDPLRACAAAADAQRRNDHASIQPMDPVRWRHHSALFSASRSVPLRGWRGVLRPSPAPNPPRYNTRSGDARQRDPARDSSRRNNLYRATSRRRPGSSSRARAHGGDYHPSPSLSAVRPERVLYRDTAEWLCLIVASSREATGATSGDWPVNIPTPRSARIWPLSTAEPPGTARRTGKQTRRRGVGRNFADRLGNSARFCGISQGVAWACKGGVSARPPTCATSGSNLTLGTRSGGRLGV